jgi:hypothetical protein
MISFKTETFEMNSGTEGTEGAKGLEDLFNKVTKYYDKYGNLLHPNSTENINIIDKPIPTNITLYNNFKTGINIKFENKVEIFNSIYKGSHELDAILYHFKDKIDYEYCLKNKDKIIYRKNI